MQKNSKFNTLSKIQSDAFEAIQTAGKETSGIVVMPCGTGKTAVAILAAINTGRKVLFLSFEKQGVIQIFNAILKNTTIYPGHVIAYTADIKKTPNTVSCYMSTTYAMFAGGAHSRSKATMDTRKFVLETANWDLVVLDEVHHAAASTYQTLVQQLKKNSRRILGFTASLCRTEQQESAHGLNGAALDAHNAERFAFIGPVLFRRNCVEVEAQGLIAKTRRMQIEVSLEPAFSAARDLVQGPTRKYVDSLHPRKLRALCMLVKMHTALGEVGMVFVNHLLHTKTIHALLGNRWAVLAGSNAHGLQGIHSAEHNASIVASFNAGELDGIITTPVGESALDATNPDFKYAVTIDAHGGPAAACQKLGRLSRTERLHRADDESEGVFLTRALNAQKHAAYYELVTSGTEEMTAALSRHAQFKADGYAACQHVSYAQLCRQFDAYAETTRQRAAENHGGAEELLLLPYETPVEQTKLLLETLSYVDLGVADKAGQAQAAKRRREHHDAKKKTEEKSQTAKHSLFRAKARADHKALKIKNKAVRQEAASIRQAAVEGAGLSENVRSVLAQLPIDKTVFDQLGIELSSHTATTTTTAAAATAATLLEPSDDEEPEKSG